MNKRFTVGLLAPLAVSISMLPTTVAAQDLTIAWSLPALEFPFFIHMQKQLRDEAGNIGGIELIETDGENSSTKQSADVEAAIVRGVDGLVISPLDSVALAPAIQQAVDAGIAVVTIDRRVDGVDGILAHVGADNVLGGEAQGNLILQRHPDGARIVNLQGEPGASPAIDRSMGLHNVIDANSAYEIVAEQTAHWKREDGASVTEAILAGLDSPPDVIVGANDEMAFGALQAVQDAGLSGIDIIGFDALPEALASVRDGGLTATIEQLPGGQSRGAIHALVDFLRDGVRPDPLVLLTPIAITADNINDAERLGEL